MTNEQKLRRFERALDYAGNTHNVADVLDAFDKQKLPYESAEITMLPENYVKVSGGEAESVLRLMERLEDLDDVQKVYANFDMEQSELERIAAN